MELISRRWVPCPSRSWHARIRGTDSIVASLRVGLAARQQRIVADYIEEHLAAHIPLALLARLARLRPAAAEVTRMLLRFGDDEFVNMASLPGSTRVGAWVSGNPSASYNGRITPAMDQWRSVMTE